MQSEEVNQNGEFYIQEIPKLKLQVMDGSALAIAIVLLNVPKGTTQVLWMEMNMKCFKKPPSTVII